MLKNQDVIKEKTAYNPAKVDLSFLHDTSATLLKTPYQPLKLNGWTTTEPGWTEILGEVATAIFDGLAIIAMIGTLYLITIILFSFNG